MAGDELLERDAESASGYIGVAVAGNKWMARAKQTYIGCFDTPLEAARARRDHLARASAPEA